MNDEARTLTLVVMPAALSVCRLGPQADLPDWAWDSTFCSVTRTGEELSIVCPSSVVPAGIRRSDAWRALRVAGTFDFDACGVLASVVGPLARAGISMLAICTFDTDYILVRERDLDAAGRALAGAGHLIGSD